VSLPGNGSVKELPLHATIEEFLDAFFSTQSVLHQKKQEISSSHNVLFLVAFVMDKFALGQVFSEYFGFPYQSFYRLLHVHHHLSSGACTIGQIVANVKVDTVSLQSKKIITKQLYPLSLCSYMLERLR
jgi:hypothetical protein